EQGQADGVQVTVDFADDELAPAIRLAPDQPLDLAAGNAVLLDLESLDVAEPAPEYDFLWRGVADPDPGAAPTPGVAEMYLDHVRTAHLPEVAAYGW
ncbi:MAG: hypothetical protein HYV63_23210, partial [Candidatus Schekmanbacteria bacterium]|nr:hypothetical protein [Candidatus Schekmanbacteria bacterium]